MNHTPDASLPHSGNPSLDGRQSAGQLISAHDLMAIPHFQRGLVWEGGSVALLLESLFYGTPCGSITLWTPEDISAEGVSLGPSGKFLIIDGQQRIRSLNGVFGEQEDEEAATDDGSRDNGNGGEETEDGATDEYDDTGTWCLNLGRIPELATQFQTSRPFHLFRHVRDPRSPGQLTPPKDREALVPLKWFLAQTPQELGRDTADPAIAKAVSALMTHPHLADALRNMRTRELFDVRVLGPEHSRADVISIYNRINSAGKRVEAEEKAFAALSLYGSAIHDELARFFAELDGPDNAEHQTGNERIHRDDLLTRQKESRFGFKLFMRAVAISLAYHSNRSLGSSSFSFDAVSPDVLRDREDDLSHIARDAGRVLADTRSIIAHTLYCDDLRTLPETHSLWPMFYLLIRFPQLRLTAEGTLASLILRLMLTDLDTKVLLRLCANIGAAATSSEALDLFDGHSGLSVESVDRSIRKRVSGTNSLTSRYTLLLYWLIRRNKARDFSYQLNARHPERLVTTPGAGEPTLAIGLRPEKQHIIPYSLLKRMFGLSGARVGRHEVHSLGNITFISQALNGFDVGVGSAPLKLAEESPDNLTAHLISPPLLPLYEAALGEGSGAKTAFGEFCKQRQGLIGLAFRDWDATLRRTAGQRPEVSYPVSRRLSPDLSDQIRALNLRQDVTNFLVSISRMPGVKSAAAIKSVQSKLSLELRVQSESGGKRTRFRLDIDSSGRLRLKLRRELAAIADAIESPFERVPRKGSIILVIELADDMVTVLRLLESQCNQLQSGDTSAAPRPEAVN